MFLEYLVSNEEDANRCIAFINDAGVESSKKEWNDYYIVTASINSESKSSAIKLSGVHSSIVGSVDCTILTNDSSAYFNRVIFPLINRFERKLRKLLYEASVISAEDHGQDKIADLESKDFGELFELLFKDESYFKSIKDYVGGKKGKDSWLGYAQDLQEYLKQETEKPLWDKLLPGQVPSLRKRFHEVQKYRNDVMHAHNTDKKTFNRAKSLFEEINNEIDEAIEALANGAIISDTYNKDLETAMAYLVLPDGDYLVDSEGRRFMLPV